MRIVTYNVLSDALCTPKDYSACGEDNIDPAKRLAKIQAKLREEIAKGSVIALEEVHCPRKDTAADALMISL